MFFPKWRNDYGGLAREKCKITWIDWGVVPVNEKEALWELIKAHYVPERMTIL
jgi:hypothetical protein